MYFCCVVQTHSLVHACNREFSPTCRRCMGRVVLALGLGNKDLYIQFSTLDMHGLLASPHVRQRQRLMLHASLRRHINPVAKRTPGVSSARRRLARQGPAGVLAGEVSGPDGRPSRPGRDLSGTQLVKRVAQLQ